MEILIATNYTNLSGRTKSNETPLRARKSRFKGKSRLFVSILAIQRQLNDFFASNTRTPAYTFKTHSIKPKLLNIIISFNHINSYQPQNLEFSTFTLYEKTFQNFTYNATRGTHSKCIGWLRFCAKKLNVLYFIRGKTYFSLWGYKDISFRYRS